MADLLGQAAPGFVDTLGKGSLDYSLLLQEPSLPARFPGSSMVEHSAVNRRVASSNLARGAKPFFFNHLSFSESQNLRQ